jgi:pimeloyl-ACP methyl ester carboxylesterase
MQKVTSKDGTPIAFEKSGQGLPIILVCGGSVDMSSNAPLAAILSQDFTVYNYNRRGRGESGDTAPYAVDREVEDLDAMIKEAGGSAFVYGTSSGAALVLEAAAHGLNIPKLVLWEPPYKLDDGSPRPPADTAKVFTDLVAAGSRGDAAEFFMAKVVGLPPEFVTFARSQPWWPNQEALAHTLAYDATIMGDYSLPAARAASVKAPTLVMAGGASWEWMRNTAQTLAGILPNGQYHIIEGQEHNVDPATIAPVMKEFLA